MPASLPLNRRVSSASRWPIGVGLTAWRYLWRTVPMHRVEEIGDPADDAPPPLPEGLETDDVQRVEDGAGPLFHRRYRTRIRATEMPPDKLLGLIAADPDAVSPNEFASFLKLSGAPGEMRVGDEFRVRMPGPWDGPVRVAERTPTSFRLVTLHGHLEAGQIIFSTRSLDGNLVFEIESWARSAGPLVDVLYDRLRVAKEVQLHMWTSVLQRAAEVAGGRITGGIDIHTRRVDPQDDDTARERLDELAGRAINYDPDAPHPASDGWRADDYCETLAVEPAGEPIDGGPFRIAQAILRDYRFADPSIVRAHYEPDAPLEGRDMLLELRFHGLRTYAGCRVGELTDERREVDGRTVRVWGWPYRTLEGHVEQGEMSWEVWKWLDTGEVQFRIHSYSRMVRRGNPLTVAGLWLVGQRERERFLRSACRRMRELTAAGVRGEDPAAVPPTASAAVGA